MDNELINKINENLDLKSCEKLKTINGSKTFGELINGKKKVFLMFGRHIGCPFCGESILVFTINLIFN
jgi:hypothetical protein